MKARQNVLISACLMGVLCRYDGKNNMLNDLEALVEKINPVPFCPEVFGGLTTPREPAEIIGKCVYAKNGADVTKQFVRGAEECVKMARLMNCRFALMKAKSPSCGRGRIYDGTFQGVLKDGDGVTVRMLQEAGITVFTENEIDQLLKALKSV